jgi:PIN domain nuclease of toxin-antitoxin system
LIWSQTDPSRLTPAQKGAFDHSRDINEELGIAAITLWEIAKLVELRRVEFTHGIDVVLRGIQQHPLIRVIRLDACVARESTMLGASMQKADPADQLIVATARVHGLRLVTSDERIRRSGTVPVI